MEQFPNCKIVLNHQTLILLIELMPTYSHSRLSDHKGNICQTVAFTKRQNGTKIIFSRKQFQIYSLFKHCIPLALCDLCLSVVTFSSHTGAGSKDPFTSSKSIRVFLYISTEFSHNGIYGKS